MPNHLTAADLEVLALEASRMGLSLACLTGAMEDGSPIVWMANEERRDDDALDALILRGATVTIRQGLKL